MSLNLNSPATTSPSVSSGGEKWAETTCRAQEPRGGGSPRKSIFVSLSPNLFFTCFSFSLADDWVPPGGALSSPPRCVAGPGRVCVPPVCKHADSRRSCIRSQWRCCWCWATCFRRSFDVRNRSNQKRLGAIDCRHDQRTPKRRDGISARLQERIRPELMIR